MPNQLNRRADETAPSTALIRPADRLARLPSRHTLELATLSRRRLELLLRQSEPPDIDALVGWEYRGLNLGWICRLLGVQKFLKGFHRDGDGQISGYNSWALQDGLAAPWTLTARGSAPARFGFFAVAPVDPASRDNRYPASVLFDYGRRPNPRNLRNLRDWVVRVNPGSDDLLLGKVAVAIGPFRAMRNFFLLERQRPIEPDRHQLAAPSH